jgi:hypothetical protein
MNDSIFLWLDDERPIPNGYTHHCKTAKEAIELLKTGRVVRISLDHDLGMYYNGTGYDVAKFIEEGAINGTLKELGLAVHTQNPVGRKNICAALQNAKKAWANQE